MFQCLQLRTSTYLKPTPPHVYKLVCPTWYGTRVVSSLVWSEKLFVFKVGWGKYLPLWVGDVFFNFKSLNTAFVNTGCCICNKNVKLGNIIGNMVRNQKIIFAKSYIAWRHVMTPWRKSMIFRIYEYLHLHVDGIERQTFFVSAVF
jgi:hypothetical protein